MPDTWPRRFARLHLLAANLRKSGYVRRGPTVLTVETTTECNLKCVTCHRTWHAEERRVMPPALFENIVAQSKGSVELMNIFGMGEPLLDPYLVRRVKICSESGIATHVATNGTLMDAEHAKALMDAGLTAVTFSMSSVRPEVYRRLHEGAEYGETARNLEGFLAIKKKRKSPVHVTVEMIRTHKTAKECDLVIRRWRGEEGVDALRIRHDEFGCVPDLLDEDEHWADSRGTCHYLWQGPLLIRADGGMYPCCVSGLHSAAVANVRDLSPRAFWASKTMTAIREDHIRGLANEILPCATCHAPKPIPLLVHLSYLASAWGIRRYGILVERFSLRHHWRLQRREIT